MELKMDKAKRGKGNKMLTHALLLILALNNTAYIKRCLDFTLI